MYDYLTDRACRVLLEMRTEAFLLDHDHTGTEHLLVAIVEVNDELAGPVLRHFGVTAESIRREVQTLVTPGIDLDSEWTTIVLRSPGPDEEAVEEETGPDSVTTPRKFTPRLTKCLMHLAPFEARELGDDHVGPEHLLLAILRAGHGTAVQALQNLGVDPPELMRSVYETIAEDPGAGDPTGPKPSEEHRQTALDKRQEMARFRMNPDDRVVFTSDDATRVFCVLDGLDRLYNSQASEEVVEHFTRFLRESFSRKAGKTDQRFTSQQELQILKSIVAGLRRRAADQLGE
jgi:ATP-dependent Clp protease ATP-binding subunit ClpA